MNFHRALFLCSGALATFFSVVPANAQYGDTVAGALQLGYVDFDDRSHTTNDWASLGSAVFTFNDPGINIQINAGNDNLDMSPFSTTTTDASAKTSTTTSTHGSGAQWRYGGDVFWRDYAGDFGVAANAGTGSSDSTSSAVTTPFGGKPETPVVTSTSIRNSSENAGLFGEFFALQELTVRAKGGWVGGDSQGFYGDGGAVYYIVRQVALDASIDYAKLSHGERAQDVGAAFEYLPVPSVPFSLQLSYTYAQYHNLAGVARENDNIIAATLKVYLDGRGSSLRDYQRTGAASWDGLPRAFGRLGF